MKETHSLLAMVLCYCALMCLLLLMMFSVLSMAWAKSTGKQLHKCCLWWAETWNSLFCTGLNWAALHLALEPGGACGQVTPAVGRCFVITLYLLKPEILAGCAKQFEITFLYGVLPFLSSNQSVQTTVILLVRTHMKFSSSIRSRCCHPYKDLVIS